MLFFYFFSLISINSFYRLFVFFLYRPFVLFAALYEPLYSQSPSLRRFSSNKGDAATHSEPTKGRPFLVIFPSISIHSLRRRISSSPPSLGRPFFSYLVLQFVRSCRFAGSDRRLRLIWNPSTERLTLITFISIFFLSTCSQPVCYLPDCARSKEPPRRRWRFECAVPWLLWTGWLIPSCVQYILACRAHVSSTRRINGAPSEARNLYAFE